MHLKGAHCSVLPRYSPLKYPRYFCILPPKEPENSFFSAVRDFCFQCPLMAVRRVIEDIPGVF